MGHMRAQPRTPHLPVPGADVTLDASGRHWVCVLYSTDPYASLWECPATDGAATWALLQVAHGPVVALRSADFAEVA